MAYFEAGGGDDIIYGGLGNDMLNADNDLSTNGRPDGGQPGNGKSSRDVLR